MKVIGEALTFDDVSLIPSFSDVLPKDVSLKTRLTTELSLNVPLVSAAIDTVTEARLAIAIAQEGGIGVVHKNMRLEDQAEQVRIVKKYEAGVIKDPITVSPNTTSSEVLDITHRHWLKLLEQDSTYVGQLIGHSLAMQTVADMNGHTGRLCQR